MRRNILDCSIKGSIKIWMKKFFGEHGFETTFDVPIENVFNWFSGITFDVVAHKERKVHSIILIRDIRGSRGKGISSEFMRFKKGLDERKIKVYPYLLIYHSNASVNRPDTTINYTDKSHFSLVVNGKRYYLPRLTNEGWKGMKFMEFSADTKKRRRVNAKIDVL